MDRIFARCLTDLLSAFLVLCGLWSVLCVVCSVCGVCCVVCGVCGAWFVSGVWSLVYTPWAQAWEWVWLQAIRYNMIYTYA